MRRMYECEARVHCAFESEIQSFNQIYNTVNVHGTYSKRSHGHMFTLSIDYHLRKKLLLLDSLCSFFYMFNVHVSTV